MVRLTAHVQLWRKGAQPTIIFTYTESPDSPDDGVASRALLCMGARYYMEGDEMAVLVERWEGSEFPILRRFTAVPSAYYREGGRPGGRVRSRWTLAPLRDGAETPAL